MRALVCAIVAAIGLAAHPAFAQADRTAAAFWKTVQATCDATAAKPPASSASASRRRRSTSSTSFGGHQIDANGRLFHFGLTEAEHEEDDGGDRPASVGHLGWWQVMKYWRALFGNDTADKTRGARLSRRLDLDAGDAGRGAVADQRRRAAARRRRRSDPETREVLREAALRAAIIDTPWSAAFISYVIRQAGVGATAFQVRQRPSRLYLRRVRGERGRADQRGRRPALSRLSAHRDQAARRAT